MEHCVVFRVGHSEVGAHGRMKVVSVVNRFQDIAGEHVDRLGFGVTDLLRGGRTWVLHRMRLVFCRVPEPGEELKIRTWYRPERDLYSLRDFSMEDARGERVVFAESSWVVLDLKRGRPVRLSSAMPRSYGENRAEYFPTGFKGIPEAEDHDITRRFDVRLHDLDINRHVNNARYFEWALEAIPGEVLDSAVPSEVEALFRTPARYGEVIVSLVKKESNDPSVYLHRLRTEGSRETCVVLRTEWSVGTGPASGATAGV